MPSRYDEKARCRVGTMDEAQFFAECEPGNAAFFRSFLAAWKKAGGELKWGAGGVGLRGMIGGEAVGVCFLAPKFAGKKDRIELACAGLTKKIGKARCDRLCADLRAAAGERVLGTSMLSVVDPGGLAKAAAKALVGAFTGLI